MKKNLNHLTMIVTLTLLYNIKTFSLSCHFPNPNSITSQNEVDESTKLADAEIENLLLNSEIPEPSFEKNPALWKVLIRQYGIQLFYTCFNIKTWLVQTYYNIKDVIYENSDKNERI